MVPWSYSSPWYLFVDSWTPPYMSQPLVYCHYLPEMWTKVRQPLSFLSKATAQSPNGHSVSWLGTGFHHVHQASGGKIDLRRINLEEIDQRAFSKLLNQEWQGLKGKNPSLQKGGFDVKWALAARLEMIRILIFFLGERGHAEHTHRLAHFETSKIT